MEASALVRIKNALKMWSLRAWDISVEKSPYNPCSWAAYYYFVETLKKLMAHGSIINLGFAWPKPRNIVLDWLEKTNKANNKPPKKAFKHTLGFASESPKKHHQPLQQGL